MSVPSSTKPKTGSTRRQFFLTGLSVLTLNVVSTNSKRQAWAKVAKAPKKAIDPGYIGASYYGREEKSAVFDVVKSGSPFRYWGPGTPNHVNHFEEQFAQYMQARFALGVTSGTTALDCAITGLDIGPGDEVILPAYTWWSDYTCIVHAGALPVFADIDTSFTIDPKSAAAKITPRTKAIIAVHLLGGACDMNALLLLAEKHKIAVLEDCAQCVGGSYQGRKLGSIGDVGIYSFQINKTMTSGEGGAVVTQNPRIYERAARFHDMGDMRTVFKDRLGKIEEAMFAGENFRMNEFTGGVLCAQLGKLDRMLADMRQNAEAIQEGIASLPNIRLRSQPDPKGDIGYAVFFDAKSKDLRDRCIAALQKAKVPASPLSGSVLLPIQESVINKRARHANWPSFSSPEGKAMQYGSSCCQQTLDIYDRFVQLRIGPHYEQRDNDYIIDQVRAVYQDLSI